MNIDESKGKLFIFLMGGGGGGWAESIYLRFHTFRLPVQTFPLLFRQKIEGKNKSIFL